MPSFGRRLNHDSRSRAFPALVAPPQQRRPVLWETGGGVLDQGHVGACVAHAAAAALNTVGCHRDGEPWRTHEDAMALYSAATKVDQWEGSYPPDDTGTDANAAATVLRTDGVIVSWSHCFGLDHVLGALQLGPVLLGIEWLDAMMEPAADGRIWAAGKVVGGHETVLVGDDTKGLVTGLNSWGAGWGDAGRYRITYDDLDNRLRADGDATVLVRP